MSEGGVVGARGVGGEVVVVVSRGSVGGIVIGGLFKGHPGPWFVCGVEGQLVLRAFAVDLAASVPEFQTVPVVAGMLPSAVRAFGGCLVSRARLHVMVVCESAASGSCG